MFRGDTAEDLERKVRANKAHALGSYWVFKQFAGRKAASNGSSGRRSRVWPRCWLGWPREGWRFGGQGCGRRMVTHTASLRSMGPEREREPVPLGFSVAAALIRSLRDLGRVGAMALGSIIAGAAADATAR